MMKTIDLDIRARDSRHLHMPIREYTAADGLLWPYFHQRFVTPDQRFFMCEGRFGEQCDVVRLDLERAEAVRLTQDGAAVHVGDLHPDGRRFFYTAGGDIRWVDVYTGRQNTLAPVPRDDGYTALGCVHITADGAHLVMGGNRTHASGVKEGCLWLVNTTNGAADVVLERPFRIGHAQSSPTDPGLLMYCHETGGASPQRMWLARAGGHHPGALFTSPGHPWVTHETFSGDGRWIIFVRNPEGLGMIRPENTVVRTFAHHGAWHPGPSKQADRIVFDTHDGDICLLHTDTGNVSVLAQGEYGGGKAHPHPCFAPDDHTVLWTSTATAQPRVCVADTVRV